MKNSKNLSLFGRTGKLQRLFLIALFSVLGLMRKAKQFRALWLTKPENRSSVLML